MTKVIAIINQKGGVGKTATTCNLAYCFAQKNKRTLLIDLDPSANATRIFVKNSCELTVKDFLSKRPHGEDAIILADQNGKEVPNLSLLPSHISLALSERELGNKPFRETLLAKKLKDRLIQTEFDLVLLDCPPTLTTLTINAMYAADMILIPVTYAKDALEGVGDLFDLLQEIKEDHRYQIKILKNQFDARKKTAIGHVAQMTADFDSMILKTIIRQDEEVNKASFDGLTVMVANPQSNAAQDYNALCNELEGYLND